MECGVILYSFIAFTGKDPNDLDGTSYGNTADRSLVTVIIVMQSEQVMNSQ